MKEKLLVLDDEPMILGSLESLFEDDFDVLTTSDAVAALQLARDQDIAVVLSDERMPELSGHEFLRQVKEISNSTRVLISGCSDMDVLADAVNNGHIFAYVTKPWDPLRLKALLQSALQHFKLSQAVDHERALLRVLMETIPDLIYFKDRDSRFTRVNREQARNLGVDNPEECIGKRDSDYSHSESGSHSYDDEQTIIRSGKPLLDRIEQLHRPNGSLCWLSTTKVPIIDKSGSVSGIAGISRDITKLIHTEESLRDQSEHNRLIIETAGDAFIGMRPDGSITAWNRQAERLFGWSAADVMGRRMSDTLVAPSHRALHAHGIEHFLTNARGFELNNAIEIDALHRDGHEFPIEAIIRPVRLAGVLSFNAFARDITERRRAAQRIRRETGHLLLLQAVTAAANESTTIENAARTSLNRICAHTGWPLGHVLFRAQDSQAELLSTGIWWVERGKLFGDFRQGVDRRRFGSGVGIPGRVLASGKPEWTVEIGRDPNFPEGGAAARAGLRSAFGFPILVEKQVVGVLEFFSFEAAQPDEEVLNLIEIVGAQIGQVFLRQRVEQDRERAVGLAESANRAKSDFIATMSHEIRTPMNALLGMADLLAESDLDRQQRDYVRIFQSGGAKLLHLINDILDLSKVESGRFDLEVMDFDLNAVLEKATEIMSVRAKEKGLWLTSEILPDVPARLSGDPDRLRQILINLIGNALKFTEQGGVSVRVERDPPAGENRLRFSVTDTGIGIPADKIDMIFESFAQVDSSTTRRYGGTGLGLAISKGLVELMAGKIGCSSELGKGSTFFFSAPFGLASRIEATPEIDQSPPAFAPSPRPDGQQPTRILIAEDSDDNLFLIEAYLKDSGFELHIARDGKQALDKATSGAYDLVLMDVEMPVMDGLTATRAIRDWEARTQSRPVPIVALTAHALKDEFRKTTDAGCTGYLSKPIKKATLLEAIYHYAPGRLQMTS